MIMTTQAPPTVIRPGDGNASVYEWQNDTITVILTGAQTAGAFTLTEDRMKPCFCLGLHMHREHAETFYILEGEVQFRIHSDEFSAGAGTTVHVPPGTPHAVRIVNGQPGRLLMLYSPAGFEDYLAVLKKLTPEQCADPEFMRAIEQRYDNITLEDPSQT